MRKFIAGGIAGCLAKGSISPFDRIKILRQGEHSIYGNLSIVQSARTIAKNEGIYQKFKNKLTFTLSGLEIFKLFNVSSLKLTFFEAFQKHNSAFEFYRRT